MQGCMGAGWPCWTAVLNLGREGVNMSNQPPPENLNDQLLLTIERQRRIICDLLIKNEKLRARVMHTEHNANELPERKAMSRQLEPGGQTARFGEMRIGGGNDVHSARSAVAAYAMSTGLWD
jgi:hypothetical protein